MVVVLILTGGLSRSMAAGELRAATVGELRDVLSRSTSPPEGHV